jgi:peptide/nickel transport system ATP-binding protein
MSLLNVEDLRIELPDGAPVVRELGFVLERGQVLGLVGESGCGKSMTALAVMGLLPERVRARGTVQLEGENLLALDETTMARRRGRRLAMIFQEPMTALNPVKTIGAQIAEGPRLHLKESRGQAEARTRRLLDRVGLPAARVSPDSYPHQLSGGQRQRVLLAIALACEPALLIADEPTTALDVTVQAQILELMAELVDEREMGLLLITHDLGVVAEMADRTLVMYAGRAVESGPTETVFGHMAHPYAAGLFGAVPAADPGRAGGRLAAIPGRVPAPGELPTGCAFRPRCPRATAECAEEPPWRRLERGQAGEHRVLCVHPLQPGESWRHGGRESGRETGS